MISAPTGLAVGVPASGQASRRASPSPGQLSGRKKALSSPVTGRKRPAFVVPPMFRAELRSLCPSVAGREPRPSPGPLRRCLPILLAVGALSMALGSACSQRSLSRRLASQTGTYHVPWFAKLALVQARCSRRLRTRTFSVRWCEWYSSGVFAVKKRLTLSGECWGESAPDSSDRPGPDRE